MALTSLALYGAARTGQALIDDKAESVGLDLPVTAMGMTRRRHYAGIIVRGLLLLLGAQ